MLWHRGNGYPFDDDKRWTVAYGGWRMMDPAWKQVLYPMIVEGILYSGQKFLDPLTGNPAAEKRAGIRQMWGCGHPTATASGLLLRKAAPFTTPITASSMYGTT